VQRILRTYRRILNAHHGRRLKLFVSEIGWASAGHRNKMVVGEKGQARLITKTFKRIGKLRRRYKISGLYYFDWKDYAPLSTDPRGDTWGYHTGLLRADGTRKPAFRAFRRSVARLR
jgi:hypothetical protein